jgi:glycosyltransferase involved in cell wall biosynthesis
MYKGILMQIENGLAILIPLYKSEDNIDSVLDFINELNQSLNINSFIRFIIDGREEDFNQLINKLKLKKVSWNYDILVLSKNFGVGPALIAGMQNIKHEFITSFGADLQEPKSLFIEMLSVMQNRDVDLCLAVRSSRQDPLIHNLGAKLFWRINRFVLGKEVPSGGFDVFMINQIVKKSMLEFTEVGTNFTSQMFFLGFRRKFVRFDRIPRKIGKSSWTFKRKVKLFFDSIFGFSDIPLKSILYVGLSMIFISIVLIIINLFFSFSDKETIPGYYALATFILLGNGVTIFFLSVIGSYVYRTFQNSTGRPPYIIKKLFSKNEIE